MKQARMLDLKLINHKMSVQVDEIEILKRALARERASRKAAEKILEDKSAELYVITEKLQKSKAELEKILAEKTSELRGVFENIVDAYIVIDLQCNVLKMNDPAIHLLGFDSRKTDLSLFNLVDKSNKMHVQKGFQKLILDGILTDFQIKILTVNKQKKIVHLNASIILDQNNNPIAAQAIVRDITKDKQAEEQLIESENRLSTLIKNLDSGVLLEDENRKIVLTNIEFCELFDIPVPPEFLVGQDCSDSAEQSKHHFQDPEAFVNRINEIVTRRELVIGDELKMTNGKILERDYVPIFKSSLYKGHLWKYRDVTLSRNYQHSIEIQRQKYRGIIANMNLGLVEVNTKDEILMINQSFSEMSGYSEAELIGKEGGKIFLVDGDSNKIEIENNKRLEGKSNSYELEVRNKKGEIRHWLISGAPNYNLNGEVVGSIGIHLDITDLKSLQLQKENLLAKLAKSNDELQEYAHIVSHDLKSPLRSIYALVSFLKEDNLDKLDDASLENISLIESTLEKMEQLISDILNYSSLSIESSIKDKVDIDKLVKDVISILYIPEHIKVKINTELPVLNGDKTKLQQVFQNLISNAVKFIDKKTGLVEVDVKEQSTHFQFSIEDNGIGINPKFHDKIFKIFHSLNARKDSSGIGLSIVKKVVDLHEGKVWLESEENVGTTFYFTIKK